MNASELIALLHNLSSSNNSTRQGAEKIYEELIENCRINSKSTDRENETDKFLLLLLYCITDISIPSHIQHLSVVLLRRLLVERETSYYRYLSENGKFSFLSTMVQTIDKLEIDNNTLRLKLAEVVGELVGFEFEENEWPDIFQYMHRKLQSSCFKDREIGFVLLGLCSNSHINFLISSSSSINIIKNIFSENLVLVVAESQTNEKCCLEAMKALSFIIPSIPSEMQLDPFCCLVDSIMMLISSFVLANKSSIVLETNCICLIEYFIEIIEHRMSFCEGRLLLVFDSLLSIAENKSISMDIRRMIIEALVLIGDSSPKKVRKLKATEKYLHIKRLANVCIELILTISDDENWEKSDTLEHLDIDDADENSHNGEISLDRLSDAIGFKVSHPIVSSIITNLLNQCMENGSWKCTYAAYQILGNFMEVSRNIKGKLEIQKYCNEVMTLFSHSIVMMLKGHSTFCHPRVKNSLFFAINQYLVMHGKNISNMLSYAELEKSTLFEFLNQQYYDLLKFLLSEISINKNPSPRLRRSIIDGISSFIDVMPSLHVEQRVSDILSAVVQALIEGPLIVQENCLAAIISLAESIRDENMAIYYDDLMPILKSLLNHAMTNNIETLYGQVFECCAILGESSGKSKFQSDAYEMMNTISKGNFGSGDINSYLLKSWVHVARCLGKDFSPYLPTVMGTLLSIASQDVSCGMTSEADANDEVDIDDIEMVQTNEGKWVAFRTSAVEEQSSACQLIVLLLEKLQEYCYPFVSKIADTMIPMLNSHHEDVRSYCMVVIPELIRCIAKAQYNHEFLCPSNVLPDFIQYSLERLLTSISKEKNAEMIMMGMQTLKTFLLYSSTNWGYFIQSKALDKTDLFVVDEPPALVPSKSIYALNSNQLLDISNTVKILLRESIQKRSIFYAEKKLLQDVDEDDLEDESCVLQESLELHFNISEVIGALLQSHGEVFFNVYLSTWHEMISELMLPHALKEDQQIAYYIISDVIENGLIVSNSINTSVVNDFLVLVLPTIIECVGYNTHVSSRQAAAYSLGIAVEKFPNYCIDIINKALAALAQGIALGDADGNPRGECTDTCVSSVGILLESMLNIGVSVPGDDFIWNQWLAYLPLTHDIVS